MTLYFKTLGIKVVWNTLGHAGFFSSTVPFKLPQILSIADHKARNRGTLGAGGWVLAVVVEAAAGVYRAAWQWARARELLKPLLLARPRLDGKKLGLYFVYFYKALLVLSIVYSI